MKIRVMVGIAALALALVACGPMQEPQADVQHWWDYDDGSAVLAAFPSPS
jgi:hypothetical protein